MRGLSRYERLALLLAAAFLLMCTVRFLSQRIDGRCRVTAARTAAAASAQEETPAPEDDWPESLLPGERIDLNTAPAADLGRLPQIGEKRAQAIVEWREEHGAFQTAEDLMRVYGIGEGIFRQIEGYITVEPTD